MICINCKKDIEPSNSAIYTAKWRHIHSKMFTCFVENDMPLKSPDGVWYLTAMPEEQYETTVASNSTN